MLDFEHVTNSAPSRGSADSLTPTTDFVLLSEVARNQGSSEGLFLLRGGSKANSYQYFGGVIISAGLDCDKLEKTIQLVAKEIQGLGDKPPPAAPSSIVSWNYAIGQMELSLEGTENRMMSLGEHVLGYGTVANPEGWKFRLARVNPSELRAVARDCPPNQSIDQRVTPRKCPSPIRNWFGATG